MLCKGALPLINMPFVISKSQRGGDVLMYEGYEYLSERLTIEGFRQWRCRYVNRYKCNSKIVTDGDRVVKEPGDHCHEGDGLRSEARVARVQMKAKARTLDAKPRNVVASELLTLSPDVMARLPKNSSMERAVRRERKKAHAPQANPQSRNFPIPEQFRDFILFDSGEDDEMRILAMGKWELVECLRGAEWFGDGTFQVVPLLFFQLYTLHARVGNNYPPCIYFLLPNKTNATYRRMIQAVMNLFENEELQPQRVLLDFEQAAISAFREEFPNSEISGCFFHLSQSVIRHVGTLGLIRRFRENVDGFQMLVRSLPALAFVPLDEVQTVFETLSGAFPDEPETNQLLSYFESNYIRGPANREPRFPPRLWNHFDDALACAPKTTNCCEGFHNSLSHLFQAAHPSIWKFLDGLQKDCAYRQNILIQARMQNNERMRSEYMQLANRLANKTRQYQEEEDKLSYLRAIAHMQVTER